jgi:DNA repair exonuclease SbcCD ATPase subunit
MACKSDFEQNLRNLSEQEILLSLDQQQKLMLLIDDVDKKYQQLKQALPNNISAKILEIQEELKSENNVENWIVDLSEKLKEQKILLNKITDLNLLCISKARMLYEEFKNHIKSINKQNLLISRYNNKNLFKRPDFLYL